MGILIAIVAIVVILSFLEIIRESRETSKPYETPIYPSSFVKAFHETKQRELRDGGGSVR